jgi:hypothetical protein
MNDNIFAATKKNSLVRVWRSTGQPGTPLVCTWVHDESAQVLPSSEQSSTHARGGLRLCA